MATTFKTLGTNDIVTTKTLLHEAIPITGSIVSGTYREVNTPTNVKNYAHGMFQSVYDYPYLSSSANHIFDLTLGYHSSSPLSGGTAGAGPVQNSKKINLYNQMSKILMGHTRNGAIRQFKSGGVGDGTFMDACYFVAFSRLLNKDEIKKGSFTLELGLSGAAGTVGGYAGPFNDRAKLSDDNAQNDYRTDSPAGEYGYLYITSSNPGATVEGVIDDNLFGATKNSTMRRVGFVFYQAGIAVITASVFKKFDAAERGFTRKALALDNKGLRLAEAFSGSTIESLSDSFRHRVWNLSFNNTTELNSTIYFCRAGHSDFNYSSNPTYLSSSKLVVKTESTDSPVSYITTVGLYSSDNEILAVAKLSEPLKKAPDTEFTIRTRLDY